MKTDLKDITFLFLIKIDSIERLENILTVIRTLQKYFITNIEVLEVNVHYNKLLKTILPKNIKYTFIEEKDPILYKTKYLNMMSRKVSTPYMSIWDVDIAIEKKTICDAISHLRNGTDIAYPYNGYCYEISNILRSIYIQNPNIKFLYKNINKMELLYPYRLTGGAVMMNTERYFKAGKENENHYGWGNEDYDRYYRFVNLEYNIYRVNAPLFHLNHPRGINSYFPSSRFAQISSFEREKFENSHKNEILDILNNPHLNQKKIFKI